MKKMFCLIIFLLTSNIYSVEVASAVATPAKKKNWEENIAPVIDGDLETHWEKKCDYKIELVLQLSNAVDLESMTIIWGNAVPKDLEVKFKTNGRKKLSGPRYLEKNDSSPDNFDLTEFNVKTRRIHVFISPREDTQLVSIKEIIINNVAVDSNISDKKTSKKSSIKVAESEVEIDSKNNEKNKDLDSKKTKEVEDDVKKIEKTDKKILI